MGWRTCGGPVVQYRVVRHGPVCHLKQWWCHERMGWMPPRSHRTPAAPGSPLAVFPHQCPPPQALFRSRHLCSGLVNAPWPSHSLEAAGPSTWRWPPVEGETTARTWTATGVEERCYSFSLVDWKGWIGKITHTYFVPYPWCCIFIDQKRTKLEIAQSQKDVKSWPCNKKYLTQCHDQTSSKNVILVKGVEIKKRKHVTPRAASSNVTATDDSLLVILLMIFTI